MRAVTQGLFNQFTNITVENITGYLRWLQAYDIFLIEKVTLPMLRIKFIRPNLNLYCNNTKSNMVLSIGSKICPTFTLPLFFFPQ